MNKNLFSLLLGTSAIVYIAFCSVASAANPSDKFQDQPSIEIHLETLNKFQSIKNEEYKDSAPYKKSAPEKHRKDKKKLAPKLATATSSVEKPTIAPAETENKNPVQQEVDKAIAKPTKTPPILKDMPAAIQKVSGATLPQKEEPKAELTKTQEKMPEVKMPEVKQPVEAKEPLPVLPKVGEQSSVAPSPKEEVLPLPLSSPAIAENAGDAPSLVVPKQIDSVPASAGKESGTHKIAEPSALPLPSSTSTAPVAIETPASSSPEPVLPPLPQSKEKMLDPMPLPPSPANEMAAAITAKEMEKPPAKIEEPTLPDVKEAPPKEAKPVPLSPLPEGSSLDNKQTVAKKTAEMSINFLNTETVLPLASQGELKKLITKAGGARFSLVAFASGGGDKSITARRVSLSRALSVRAFMIENGVDKLKINVQAEGDKNDGGAADRVDIFIVK